MWLAGLVPTRVDCLALVTGVLVDHLNRTRQG